MILNVYSIRDRVVGVFHPPLYLRSHDELRRLMRNTAHNWKSVELPPFMKAAFENPTDHDVYHIGTFDDSEGLIKSIQPQVVVEMRMLPGMQPTPVSPGTLDQGASM